MHSPFLARSRERRNSVHGFKDVDLENDSIQCQNLALTILCNEFADSGNEKGDSSFPAIGAFAAIGAVHYARLTLQGYLAHKKTHPRRALQ